MKMYKLHLKKIIPNAFFFKKKCEELYLIIVLSHVLFYFVSITLSKHITHYDPWLGILHYNWVNIHR
jgi:hypothetical protein